MTLAEQKQKQNIVEYVLFIWQMEDLIRAVQFNPEDLDEFIRSYTPSKKAFKSEKLWFNDLVKKMKLERVEHKGHISEVHELMFELNFLHNTLVSIIKDKSYIEHFRKAQPNMAEYMKKNDGKGTSEVESCFVALYGLMLLRLKKAPISIGTEDAMKTFSDLLARLAFHYRMMKEGEKNYSLN